MPQGIKGHSTQKGIYATRDKGAFNTKGFYATRDKGALITKAAVH